MRRPHSHHCTKLLCLRCGAGPWAAAASQAALLLCCLPAAFSADFKTDIAPILDANCNNCHSAAKKAGGIALTSRQELVAKGVLVPGKPEASSLYTTAALPAGRPGAMPPTGPRLTAPELAALKTWIAQGADWPVSPAESKLDEHSAVKQIHDRILAAQPKAAAPYTTTIPNTTVSYQMLPIPAGDFLMGSPQEAPQHKVHVDAFWMQAHEVTWDEYRLFMFAAQAGEVAHKDETVDAVSRPTRPYVEMSFGMGINGYPAISMTQHAANKYAEWLSAKTGEFYRLPTEAEWEYACRAGDGDPKDLGDYAWYAANSGGKYQKVATKKPNAWGLYDMLGNVMEWTLDQYAPYTAQAQVNPWVRPTQPYPIVARGGSWNDPAAAVNCTVRVGSDPSWKQEDPQLPKSIWYETDAQWLGFRLVRPAKIPSAEEMYRYWNNGVEHDEQ